MGVRGFWRRIKIKVGWGASLVCFWAPVCGTSCNGGGGNRDTTESRGEQRAEGNREIRERSEKAMMYGDISFLRHSRILVGGGLRLQGSDGTPVWAGGFFGWWRYLDMSVFVLYLARPPVHSIV